MAETIKDGTGTGNLAKVNSDNELLVLADTVPHLASVSEGQKKAFYIRTDFVPLTSTGIFSGIVYVKNDTTTDEAIKIQQLRTCSNVVSQWKLIRNPTTGTLISTGTASQTYNLNTGGQDLTATTIKIGADSSTVTDGDLWATWQNGVGHSTGYLEGAIIIAAGDSFALTCKPAAAGDVCSSILITMNGN